MPTPVLLGPDGQPLRPEKLKSREELRAEYVAGLSREELERDYVRFKAASEAMAEARAEVDALCNCEVSKAMAAGGRGWTCNCGRHTHARLKPPGFGGGGVCPPCFKEFDKATARR